MLETILLIGKVLEVVQDIIDANGDRLKEEEALMKGQETLKAELDRRKFT